MNETEPLLIVDDEEISRAILGNLFDREYSILEASDGQEALDILRQHNNHVSALLLDVIMPRMNGLELLRILHHKELTKQFPVFLITAEAADDTMQRAYELGVMDIIIKPITPYVVHRRVNSIVELYRARRQLGATVAQQRDQLLLQTQQLASLSMGMVESLATAIEFRSDESGQHVRRIRDITCHLLRHTALGEGFSENEIRLIGVGAITHDVGKISVPDAILHKRGRLSPEEFEIIKSHTVKGAELLAQIPQMRQHEAYRYAYDIALHHHERWDGRGYPDGLVGDAVPIWTQIVALADVYDALVSKRCYKDPYSAKQAVEMISDGSCGAFNPALLKAFLQEEPTLRQLYDLVPSAETTQGVNSHDRNAEKSSS